MTPDLRARMLALLERLANKEVGDSGVGMCVVCGGDGIWHEHTPDCALRALLEELRREGSQSISREAPEPRDRLCTCGHRESEHYVGDDAERSHCSWDPCSCLRFREVR